MPPEGSANFILAALILMLKMLVLWRWWRMPWFGCYMLTACFNTFCYLAGWQAQESAWSASLSVLAVGASLEAIRYATTQGQEENMWIFRWGTMLGVFLCFVVWLKRAETYPNYSPLVYFIRLYCGTFAVGFLVPCTMYCFAQLCGISLYLRHAWILTFRIAGMTALLLVHDRALWFAADLIGEAVNILTLCGWLWLLPRRVCVKPAV